MVNINFNLRDAKSATQTPVNCVIRYNNQKLVFPTGINVPPKFWDNEAQKVKTTKSFPTNPQLNERLSGLRTLIQREFRNFENDNGAKPTTDQLKNALKIATNGEPKEIKTNLLNFILKFADDAKFKVNKTTGKTYTYRTIATYKQLYGLLTQFNSKRKRAIDFNDIDLEFYNDFTAFLTKEKQFSVNTIGKFIKTLKTILNEALERGLTNNLKFKSKKFVVIKQDADTIYLNETELLLIRNLDLSHKPKLERVRDLFLIGCFTGLRFSDFSTIKNENFNDNTLRIETKKTGQKVVIPIHPAIMPIFDKYIAVTGSPIPKMLSNQKMNDYIKEFSKMVPEFSSMVSIKENKAGTTYFKNYQKFELITTHTARRSFATNNYKSGLPAQVIMGITGHKTEKSFLTYIKVTPTENAEIMRLHWAKLSNLKVS